MGAATVSDGLSRSVEDYLKAVYLLSLGGGQASTSGIAERLEVSAPSVSGMLRRLAEQGLVAHMPYRGVELTEAGRRVALRVVRRHRILETYLAQRLGLTWDQVHVEAERLEHAVSDRVLERMAAALGHPNFDPHGDPIPSAEGTLPAIEGVALTDVPLAQRVVLRRVLAEDGERLRYLATLGLMPGAQVTVLLRAPFDGPLSLRVGRAEPVIAHALARLLLCDTSAVPDA